ncbi:MAG TPA: divergent polysaccharide deacetylase family protein [Thermoanaerobaculia bacterium]|nr:divergent polysaccharide deacetylase family protein [Thermoanaerobaculia bacterium]
MDDGARATFRTIAVLTLIPVVAFGLFYLYSALAPSDAVPTPAAKPAPAKPQPRATQQTALPRVRASKPRIVLIIDDLGFEGQPLDRVMSLDPNVNCAILPNSTRAAAFAEKLHARGYEILCHLPMEPRGSETPGRNAILTSMSDDEIAKATRENVDAVPYARGVNNHMGSLATSDRRVMESVFRGMPKGMYFVDSRTIGSSVAAEVAREMNVRTAARNVFLDDGTITEATVRRQLAELAAAAERHGVAVGIGHPHPATMRVLAEGVPELRAKGFRFVRASEVVR